MTTTAWRARAPEHLERVQQWTQPRRARRTLSPQGRAKLEAVARILTATRDRPANFSCYGMHEWAMVYRGQTCAMCKSRHSGFRRNR